MPVCKLCGAEILWRTTTNGAWMPLDPKPDPLLGRVFLHGEKATVLNRHDLRNARKFGEELYVPHWKTCRIKGEGT